MLCRRLIAPLDSVDVSRNVLLCEVGDHVEVDLQRTFSATGDTSATSL